MLAEAVQELWPGTQVTIGPVIENGFYYDFKREVPFSEEEFPLIEKKMAEIVARGAAFTKEVGTAREAKRVFAAKGENFKVELIDAIPADQQIKIYKQGQWFDLCRGPHMPLDQRRRHGLQADQGGRWPIGAATATIRC